MPQTLRRWLRRAFLGGAAGCLILAALAPSSRAQGEPEVVLPEVFDSSASSLVASVQVDRDALIPVPGLFQYILLDGTGTYESSDQKARASLFFPGNGGVRGPSLACSEGTAAFPEQFAPLFAALAPVLEQCLRYNYPLSVFADSLHPDRSTTGSLGFGGPGDSVSGHAVSATAHAGLDAVTTDAAMNDFHLLGLPAFSPSSPPIPGFELDASLFEVDSATSRTNQRFVGSKLVTDATATLSGVKLLGGLVHIGSIISRSTITDDAQGKKTTDASLEISGVTAAGQPATITDKGLTIGPNNQALGPLQDQIVSRVQSLLSAFNASITVLPSTKSVDQDGIASAQVGGVLFEFERDISGLPEVPFPTGNQNLNGKYEGSILLATTGVKGLAASFDDDFIDGGTDFVPGDTGTDFVPGDAGTGFVPGDSGPISNDEPTDQAGPTGQSGGSPTRRVVSFVDELFRDRLGMLYLAFTLSALAFCVAPRLTVPARLPRQGG